jgi:hypothetical protein
MADVSNVKETTDYMIPDARQFPFGLEGNRREERLSPFQ